MAAAVEHVHLHKRIALNVMRVVGTSPRMLILSFILPTAFLSMWISNTATTAMMVPIMEAVMSELDSVDVGQQEGQEAKGQQQRRQKVRAMLAMSICMAANIGGTGTTIGTGPNLILLGILDDNFNGHPVSFGSWMAYAFPIELVCLLVLWLWLQFYFLPWPRLSSSTTKDDESSKKIHRMIVAKCGELGPLTFAELVVLVHFVCLVLLWFFRSPGFFSSFGDMDPEIDDATPAIAVVILLFLMPDQPSFLKLRPAAAPLIDWKTAEKRVPWGIVLLLGGGFALAAHSKCSGLNDWIGRQLSEAIEDFSPFAALIIACLIATVLTQVASNTASASILMPILAKLGATRSSNPLLFMLPPTMVTSFAFMLPVSTPPNAIAFGPSGLRTVDMIKVGTFMNIACLAVTLAATYSYGVVLFDLDEFPQWANSTLSSAGNETTEVSQCTL